MSPWEAMKLHPLGECAMGSSLGLRPRDLNPLHIHPRDAISLPPSGSCGNPILQQLHTQFKAHKDFP